MAMPSHLSLTGNTQGAIEGSCDISGREGTILVYAMEHLINIPRDTHTGLPTGKRIHGALQITKEIDKASPNLAEAICKGKVFPKVEIHVTASTTDAGRVTYYIYDLKNVMVTSYDVSGSGQAEEVPMETFALNFEEIKVTYTECDREGKTKGKVEYSWKVEEAES